MNIEREIERGTVKSRKRRSGFRALNQKKNKNKWVPGKRHTSRCGFEL